MDIRNISFKQKNLDINYRDDSDNSVIDEFFVDKMYRSLEDIISNLQNPILDIGAHIGIFSLYARILNPTVTIFALEPHSDNIQLFKQNISLNNIQNIQLLPYALIDTDVDKTKLFISQNSHNHTTSLEHSKTTALEHIVVPAITLKELVKKKKIKKIGLLKMDIEGAEFEIVKTLDHASIRIIEHIAIEYHEDKKNTRTDLEKIIRENGFSVEHFPNKYDKKFGLLVGRNKRV